MTESSNLQTQSDPQPSAVKTFPAKSPPSIKSYEPGLEVQKQKRYEQKVRSTTILFGPKCEDKSQSVSGKLANGVPQVEVSIDSGPFFTSLGTEPSVLDQNQTLIALLVLSIAYLLSQW